MKAATPKLAWTPSKRTIETVQSVLVSEFYITQSAMKQIVQDHVMTTYGLSYNQVELNIMLLDINRTDDAALVRVTKPEISV